MKTQYIPDGWGFDKWVHPTKSKKQGKGLKIFVVATLIALFCLGLFSCKTPKDTALHTKQKEDKNIVKDLEVNHDARLNEAISKALEKVLKEKLNIKLNQVKYDTDKPIDPETGKPPIKEETNIDLTKESEETTNENIETETSNTSTTNLIDKGKEHIKTDIEYDEESKAASNWWQKLISGIVLTVFGIWGTVWGIKKLLKWKLNR